jgi:hypothetical protein
MSRHQDTNETWALLTLALTLAKGACAELQSVDIEPDGSLRGLAALERSSAANVMAAALSVLVHEARLFTTLRGDALAREVVRSAWLDLA